MEYTQVLIQKIREAKDAKRITNEDISDGTAAIPEDLKNIEIETH